MEGTVAVVGGGVVGCFIAYRLAAMGVSITLVEQEGPGAGATGIRQETFSLLQVMTTLTRSR